MSTVRSLSRTVTCHYNLSPSFPNGDVSSRDASQSRINYYIQCSWISRRLNRKAITMWRVVFLRSFAFSRLLLETCPPFFLLNSLTRRIMTSKLSRAATDIIISRFVSSLRWSWRYLVRDCCLDLYVNISSTQ